MKLLAFLKDSYREAINGWVLQVMLVLSLLLVLFVFSVSFRPITVQDELARTFGLLNTFLSPNDDFGRPTWKVENYSQTNQIEPWRSDYSFELVVTTPSAEDMEKFKDKTRGSNLPGTRASTERFIAQGFDFLENLEVKDISPKPAEPAPAADKKGDEKKGEKAADKKGDEKKEPAEARFLVTTRGTAIKDPLEWRHEPTVLFFWEIPLLTPSLRQGVYMMEKWLVNDAGAWIALFVSIIITAGFIPNMLGKGTFDLISSKPVSRPMLLVYKYVGGMMFMFLVTAFTAVGVWLAIGLRTGLWTPHFLAIIPLLTFSFAILYAVSTLAAVLTRSTLVAILATGVAWALFWGIGKVNDGIANLKKTEAEISDRLSTPRVPRPGDEEDAKKARDEMLRKLDPNSPLWGFIPRSTFPAFTALHAITPRTFELDNLLSRTIAAGVLTEREMRQSGYPEEPRENWAEVILVSLAFIVLMLGLASWRLVTRDG